MDASKSVYSPRCFAPIWVSFFGPSHPTVVRSQGAYENGVYPINAWDYWVIIFGAYIVEEFLIRQRVDGCSFAVAVASCYPHWNVGIPMSSEHAWRTFIISISRNSFFCVGLAIVSVGWCDFIGVSNFSLTQWGAIIMSVVVL